MIRKIKTQVIIIGAGPAGAATSIFLSKAGIQHLILEKEKFPRDKVCGDACGGKTAFVLRKADPLWMEEIFQRSTQYMPTHGALFFSPDGRSLSIPFSRKNVLPGQAAGFTTPRLTFDNFLFEKLATSYSEIHQNVSLKTIQRTDEGLVKVNFIEDGKDVEVTAPLMIGADGDKSQVRKVLLNRDTNSKAYCVALRSYYKGVTGLHSENYIELHWLTEVVPGYFWIFPLPNGLANVGIGMLSEQVRKKKLNLREVMLHAIEHSPNLRPRFMNATRVDKIQGWGLPMCLKQEPVSGNNFMLVGDAANLVDPFTGEGIGNALYSGMLAAEACRDALHDDKFDADFLEKKYDDRLFGKIGAEMKTSALLQRLVHYPWLLKFVVNRAYKSPTLNHAIQSMFVGVNLRKELRKPSFYVKVMLNR
ncbi:MAG TPA: NAD(P)/FAD-dependent oxidoreductase [Chryseolinea sp.]